MDVDKSQKSDTGSNTYLQEQQPYSNNTSMTSECTLEGGRDDRYVLLRRTFIPTRFTETDEPWLDLSNPAEKIFADTYGIDFNRGRLGETEANFYVMNERLYDACATAATECHRMAIAATRRVLESDDLLRRFQIDEKYWGRLRRSYETQSYPLLGRFDLAVDQTGTQLKMFEYNADSASTLLECGVVQQKWAAATGLCPKQSFSSGKEMTARLEQAWQAAIDGGVVAPGSTVHFLVDDDDEERYTGQYVAQAAEACGLRCEFPAAGLDGLMWHGAQVCDRSSGEVVKTVWKTWAWETVITDAEDDEKNGGGTRSRADGATVRLCDVLLGSEDIHVFEPMWKMIPGNKAILPILSEMFPDHTNLLKTTWEPTAEMVAAGYARKPIVGRQGMNVALVGPGGHILQQEDGKFGDREHVYQELFVLPKYDDYYPLLGGWMVGHKFGGVGLREDLSLITNNESPCSCVRVRYNQ